MFCIDIAPAHLEKQLYQQLCTVSVCTLWTAYIARISDYSQVPDQLERS